MYVLATILFEEYSAENFLCLTVVYIGIDCIYSLFVSGVLLNVWLRCSTMLIRQYIEAYKLCIL